MQIRIDENVEIRVGSFFYILGHIFGEFLNLVQISCASSNGLSQFALVCVAY